MLKERIISFSYLIKRLQEINTQLTRYDYISKAIEAGETQVVKNFASFDLDDKVKTALAKIAETKGIPEIKNLFNPDSIPKGKGRQM